MLRPLPGFTVTRCRSKTVLRWKTFTLQMAETSKANNLKRRIGVSRTCDPSRFQVPGRGAQARRGDVSSSTVHLSENNFQGCFTLKSTWEENNAEDFRRRAACDCHAVGLAQAHGMGHHMHRHMIAGCPMGQPAAATCACGTAANHRPLLCHKGQWCHPSQACTM